MLILAVVVGAITAYYFGLRAGGYAAAGSFAFSIVAMIVPKLTTPMYVMTAIALVAVWQIGSRRPRPTDSVLAVRFLKSTVSTLWSKFASKKSDD